MNGEFFTQSSDKRNRYRQAEDATGILSALFCQIPNVGRASELLLPTLPITRQGLFKPLHIAWIKAQNKKYLARQAH